MLIWNRKDFVKKALKTPDLYFKFGDEVPEDELAPGTKESLIAKGHLIEKKAEAPKKPAPKPLPLPAPTQPPPELEPEPQTESKPKLKKKGRK